MQLIRRLLTKLVSWWLLRKIEYARSHANRWQTDASHAMKVIARERRKLDKAIKGYARWQQKVSDGMERFREELEELKNHLDVSLEEPKQVIERYERVEELLQARIEVLEKVQLHGTVLAHQELCKRIEAGIAASSRQQAHYESGGERGRLLG